MALETGDAPLDVAAQPTATPSGRPGVLFHLAAASAISFIVTVLALVATVFADPQAPVNIWLNRHGSTILGSEVALIVVCGLGAMARDEWLQRQTEARLPQNPAPPQS
ncbi:MAG: hypothetical protein SFV23_22850 [Planctomycetaceae bacterium]|nr:hypothetical protein [Planctomycetaceae bacterium]